MLKLYGNIKKEREEKGISQSELAKKVGYSDRSMIAKIENGKVDLSQSKIEAIAKALGTTSASLMGWDEQKNSDPIVIAAAGGGLTDVDERFREILKEKQTLCETIVAANLDKRQIKELIALVKTFEKL